MDNLNISDVNIEPILSVDDVVLVEPVAVEPVAVDTTSPST